MPYTADKPRNAHDSNELRQRIPGWGVDLDPKDRPAVPREQFDPGATGAHWDFPERQEELVPREMSPEHEVLPPVFGTTCPPRGLSGAIRRRAYGYSEGQSIHWLLLLAADRVDVIESSVEGLFLGRPDNPITETGVVSEFTHGGLSSRLGKNRVDVKHQALDPVIVAAPWVLMGAAAFVLARAISEKRRTD